MSERLTRSHKQTALLKFTREELQLAIDGLKRDRAWTLARSESEVDALIKRLEFAREALP